MLSMLAAVAEMERDLLGGRTQAGLVRAREDALAKVRAHGSSPDGVRMAEQLLRENFLWSLWLCNSIANAYYGEPAR